MSKLYKALKFESQVDMDARTFKGYASTWDLDLVGDVIHKGAFTKSIQEAFPKNNIKVLWEHGSPIGLPTVMQEDEKGLYVEGRISKTSLGDETLELMNDGVVDKMSIGFSIPKGKSDTDENDIRHIKEVKLFEFSPVTFAANPATSIDQVQKALSSITNGGEITYEEFKALFKQEPGDPTLTEKQPPELEDIKSMFSDFNQYIANKR